MLNFIDSLCNAILYMELLFFIVFVVFAVNFYRKEKSWKKGVVYGIPASIFSFITWYVYFVVSFKSNSLVNETAALNAGQSVILYAGIFILEAAAVALFILSLMKLRVKEKKYRMK